MLKGLQAAIDRAELYAFRIIAPVFGLIWFTTGWANETDPALAKLWIELVVWCFRSVAVMGLGFVAVHVTVWAIGFVKTYRDSWPK